MKKIIYSIFLLFLILVVISTSTDYTIKDLEISLKNEIAKMTNRPEVEILNTVQLDGTNSFITLYRKDNGRMGFAQVKKGWNGKYKIQFTGGSYDKNAIIYRDIPTNKGPYAVVIGFDKNENVSQVRVQSHTNEQHYLFVAEVYNKDYYVFYSSYPKEMEDYWGALVVYDSKGNKLDSY